MLLSSSASVLLHRRMLLLLLPLLLIHQNGAFSTNNGLRRPSQQTRSSAEVETTQHRDLQIATNMPTMPTQSPVAPTPPGTNMPTMPTQSPVTGPTPTPPVTDMPTQSPATGLTPTSPVTDTSTQSPVTDPTPAPTEEADAGGQCFSGDSHVDVQLPENGEVIQKRMDALQIGDKVLVGNGSFATVYSFGHKSADQWADYIRIHSTASKKNSSKKKKSTIEISKEHMIRLVVGQNPTVSTMVPAQNIKVGDRLVSHNGSVVTVESIRQVQRRGVYAPLTTTGDIMVGGVVASNYVSRSWMEDFATGQTLHWLQHGAVLPYRLYCAAISGDHCHGETYDDVMGFSPWVMFWNRVEQWQLGLPPAKRALFLTVLAVPATVVVMVGMLLAASDSTVTIHILACLFGYCVWKKSQRKHCSASRVEKPCTKAT